MNSFLQSSDMKFVLPFWATGIQFWERRVFVRTRNKHNKGKGEWKCKWRRHEKRRVERMSMKIVARSCLNVVWLRNRLLGLCLCRWADPEELAVRWSLLPCSWHLAEFLSILCLFYICGWERCCRIERGTYLVLLHANDSRPYCMPWFHPLAFWSFILPLRQSSADLLGATSWEVVVAHTFLVWCHLTCSEQKQMRVHDFTARIPSMPGTIWSLWRVAFLCHSTPQDIGSSETLQFSSGLFIGCV